MSSFKLIAFLFPFVKEMILGEKTIREAIRTNKMRVFLIGLILLSFFLNIVFIPKLVKISADYVILDRKYKEMDQHATKLSSHPVIQPPVKPERKPHSEPKIEPPASFVATPSPPEQPVTPPPVPPQDTPQAPADVPPEPVKREKRRYHPPHGRNEPPMSSSTTRYNEWKRTLDAIRAQESRETGDATNNQ